MSGIFFNWDRLSGKFLYTPIEGTLTDEISTATSRSTVNSLLSHFCHVNTDIVF